MSTGLTIKKSNADTAELIIYDVIGGSGISSKDVIDQLKSIGDVKEINVRINSPGGSGFDGIAIFNALERSKATVSVDVDGLAASAAALVAMAAAPGMLRIASNARMMIHNASAISDGDKNDLNVMVERLRSLDDVQASTFAKRMKTSKQEIMDMMQAETWFSAKDAVQIGLADQITGSLSIAACADAAAFSKFKHLPAELAAQLKTGDIEMTDAELQAKIETVLKAQIDPLKAEHTAALEQLKADHAAEIAALKGDATPPAKKPEKTFDELLADHTAREKELRKLHKNSGLSDEKILDGWLDKRVSVLEAKAEVGDLLIKQNTLIGDDAHGDKGHKSGEATLRAEYRANAKLHSSLGMNEDDWVKAEQKMRATSAA